jgi:hypothetical protein
MGFGGCGRGRRQHPRARVEEVRRIQRLGATCTDLQHQKHDNIWAYENYTIWAIYIYGSGLKISENPIVDGLRKPIFGSGRNL